MAAQVTRHANATRTIELFMYLPDNPAPSIDENETA
jgi:hypothetical protein